MDRFDFLLMLMKPLELFFQCEWGHHPPGKWKDHKGTAPEGETRPLLTHMGSFKPGARTGNVDCGSPSLENLTSTVLL